MMESDSRLIESFEKQTLSIDDWHQRTHVAIAYAYLNIYGFDEALGRLREGIKAFNQERGIEESAMSGYNETTTVAFLRIIHTTMLAYGEVFPTGNATEFCDRHPQLLNKYLLRLFYSPGRRMHPEAKVRFVEPDLTPLPELPGKPILP